MFGMQGQDFINTADFSQEQIHALIDLALEIKSGKTDPRLTGKLLATVFFNPSVRTRTSFAAGMFKLGGLAIDLTPGKGAWTFEFADGVVMDGQTVEHVKEAAPVLAGYCDALAVRSSELITTAAESVEVAPWDALKEDTVVRGFAKYAPVPVINMESNVYHPCQGLGDATTIKEHLGAPQGKKYVLTWAYHPKALPMATPNSQMLAACDLGMDVVVANPPDWDLEPEILTQAEARATSTGGSLDVVHDQAAAFADADVVCAKSWGALNYYGNWAEEAEVRSGLKHWIVDAEKMALTDDAAFMHCLPIRRNVVATGEVLDSDNSIVIPQAENRMWAQMALLVALLS
jgi:N-acetylornithine carbamoyltransferase